MRYGAVIVAAGMSTRMKQFKQMMKVGDLSFAQRVVTSFKNAGVKTVVMVTGYQAEQLENSLKDLGVVFVRNEKYAETQMFDSAKLGLAYLQKMVERVFFTPVDIPFFLEDTVRLEMTRKERLVYPICHNRIGHPVLFNADMIPDILRYEGPGGLKGAFDSLYTRDTCFLPVQDAGSVMDADTREDLQYIIDLQNSRLMRVEAQITLINNKGFFGPETYALLKQIMALGSVREACSKVHISYSKGWQIIHSAEQELGYRIITRRAGGKNGGSSHLTKRGVELVQLYEILDRRVAKEADQEFCALFSASSLFPKSTREKKVKK
jgi:molybdenum cofactor cytidylyltransferase